MSSLEVAEPRLNQGLKVFSLGFAAYVKHSNTRKCKEEEAFAMPLHIAPFLALGHTHISKKASFGRRWRWRLIFGAPKLLKLFDLPRRLLVEAAAEEKVAACGPG